MSLISISDLKFHFGAIELFNGLEFTLDSGQSVAITGRSGQGKSTLLSLIAGLNLDYAGNIHWEKEELRNYSRAVLTIKRSEFLSLIYQNFQLVDSLTARENIELPLAINKTLDSEKLARDYLEKVGLSDRADHYPHQLSGGEKQRIAIARALATKPKVILADEPSGNLDEETSSQVMELLFALTKQMSLGLVLVTHDLSLASQCDRHLRLENKRLIS